jgi:transcriptional/translational regulatory protein YebC/TACO1
MFDKKGVIEVEKGGVGEEELMDLALEAGAEDVVEEESGFQVLTAPEDFDAVREALEQAGVTMASAEVSMVPKNTIEVTEEDVAKSLMKLLDNLEEHDDVQNVHANFDMDDALVEKLS